MASISYGSVAYERQAILERHKLKLLQERFPTLLEFAEYVFSASFRWTLTPMQKDIVHYLGSVDGNAFVQAPRGQAKTTLMAVLAVFRLIHDPTCRIVVMSGGEDLASDIAKFINNLLRSLEPLHFMLPKRELNDTDGTSSFDISGYLRGVMKDRSVSCGSIGGSFAGIRADLIIADDLERDNNATTAKKRDTLKGKVQDLIPLMDGSKPDQQILNINTPQSIDSVSNELPSMGYTGRIYPARVPTDKEVKYYGEFLAPYVRKMYDDYPGMRTGFGLNKDRGAPTDPLRYDEDDLIQKELGQQGGKFELQYMLNTGVSDEFKYPLNLDKLMVLSMDAETAPVVLDTLLEQSKLIPAPTGFSVPNARIYELRPLSAEYRRYDSCVIYIDPSGGGKTSRDEVAVAAVKSLNGTVYVDKVLGLQGGYKDDNLHALSDIIKSYWVQGLPMTVYVESNYGGGMFTALLEGVLREEKVPVGLTEDTVSTQKETRIISIMEPLLNSKRLVFNKEILRQDVATTQHYPVAERRAYSLFHQMRYITSERGSLRHDDRLDALAGACKFFSDILKQDTQDRLDSIEREEKRRRIIAHYGPQADAILEILGLGNGHGKAQTHKDFGAFKHMKERETYAEEYKAKLPHEAQRKDAEQRARAEFQGAGGIFETRGPGRGSRRQGYFRFRTSRSKRRY